MSKLDDDLDDDDDELDERKLASHLHFCLRKNTTLA